MKATLISYFLLALLAAGATGAFVKRVDERIVLGAASAYSALVAIAFGVCIKRYKYCFDRREFTARSTGLRMWILATFLLLCALLTWLKFPQ